MFNVSVRKIAISAIVIAAPVAMSFGASSEAWGGHTTNWEKTSTHAGHTTNWEKTSTQAGKTTNWEIRSTTNWE